MHSILRSSYLLIALMALFSQAEKSINMTEEAHPTTMRRRLTATALEAHMDAGQYWTSYPTSFYWTIVDGTNVWTSGWSATPVNISLGAGEHIFQMDSAYNGWYGATVTLKTTGGVIVAGPFTLASGTSGAETFTAAVSWSN